MASVFGVHLGNRSACLAICSNKSAKVIANDSGDRVTPAFLALNGSEWEVGLTAKMGQARNKSVVTSNKRLLNYDWDNIDIANVEIASTCKIIADDDEKSIKYEMESDGHKSLLTPHDVATKLYGKMFSIAANAERSDDDLKVVLAAPLTWSAESCAQLAKCAELAGFDVLQVISEPVAATLAYIGNNDDNLNILVYRLGGTSSDASLIKVSNGLFSIENSVCVRDLGGECLTSELTNYIAEEFYKKWKIDPRESRRSMKKIFQHADNCKHILSTMSSAHIFIESLLDGVDWSQNVTRARFENIISNKIPLFVQPLHDVLKGFSGTIDKIIICGGTMKIPKLQQAVSSMFPAAELLSTISPDEVIAEGCARQAGNLVEIPNLSMTEVDCEVDCINCDIFITYLGKTHCLFKKGAMVFSHAEHILKVDGIEQSFELSLHDEKQNVIEKILVDNNNKLITAKATLELDRVLIEVF